MKNNKLMRAASVLLIMALLSTCVIFGTFAKYTSSAKGNSSITVAAWSIVANGDQIAVEGKAPTLKFNLFETVKDSDGTSAEDDVAAGKIAPGTSGSFVLKVVNYSEVTADIDFVMSGTNSSGIPVEFCASTGSGDSAWTTNLSDLAKAMHTQLAMNGASNASKDITVKWRWIFDGDDGYDTQLGITASKALATGDTAPNYTMVTTLTATQVD